MRKIQLKITEKLAELPRNRKILLERELEKERRILMKEAKEEIWKKWRQKKGRNGTNPKLTTKEDRHTMEEKLKRVELEVAKYREVVEKRKKEEEEQRQRKTGRVWDETEEKKKRLQRKKRLEGYWENLRWVTKLLDETVIAQFEISKKRKEDEEGEERKKSWEEKSEEQKIEALREEEAGGRIPVITQTQTGRKREPEKLRG